MIKFSDITYYDIDDVAGILNVRRQTVYGYVWQGRLKSRRLGRRTYVSEQELKDFVSKGFKVSKRRKEATMR